MFSQSQHLEEISNRIHLFKEQLAFLNLDEKELKNKPSEKRWSAEECFQHLVVMWQCYKPQFDKAIDNARLKQNDTYKMGWFGKWFAQKMEPLEETNTGMKTARIFEPQNISIQQGAVHDLIKTQDEMLDYLSKMQKLDINKSKIVSPASQFIRLKLGDIWVVLLNHQDRHLQQAIRAAGK